MAGCVIYGLKPLSLHIHRFEVLGLSVLAFEFSVSCFRVLDSRLLDFEVVVLFSF